MGSMHLDEAVTGRVPLEVTMNDWAKLASACTFLRYVAGALLISTAPFVSTLAQESRSQHSIGIVLGASLGSLDENCTNCSGSAVPSFSRLAIEGQALAPITQWMSLGVEGMLWKGEYLGLERKTYVISVVTSFRPSRSLKLGLDVGAGYMKFKEIAKNGSSDLESSALGLQLGAHYQIPIGSSFSILPFVRFLRSVGVKTTIDGGQTPAKIAPQLMRFGIAIALQWQE